MECNNVPRLEVIRGLRGHRYHLQGISLHGRLLKRLPDRRSKDVIHGLRKHMAGLLLLQPDEPAGIEGPEFYRCHPPALWKMCPSNGA